MNKKGQAAMEFLMTYGWAILVVLAAIGALAYFGVLSPDRFMPSKCMVSGGFSCTEYKMAKNADEALQTVSFKLQNNLGVDADSVVVSLADTAGTNCSEAAGDYNFGATPNGAVIGLMTFNNSDNCDMTGSSFKGTITVLYVRGGESVSHSAGGSISGRFD
jgi:hypothetical protein